MIIDSPIISGSASASGSFNQFGSVAISGSLTVTGSIIGNLTGTSSYATTASYALNTTSASYAATASYAANVPETSSYAINALSASYAANATSASYAANSTSASYAATASYAVAAISASYAQTASYATNIVISGSIANVDYIDFDLTASFASALGRLGYDSGEGTLQFGLAGGNVTLNIGEDLYQYCYNAETSSMTKGQVVYVSGSQGNRIAIKLADNSADRASASTLGFVAETITAGGQGWVMTEGNLRKLNTVGLIGGKLLYLGTTPGTYTQTKPVAPLHEVRLGYAERIDNNVGSIYIKIDNGYEIGELHDVFDSTTTSSYGDLLVKSGSVWINSKQLTGSYGVTGSITATSLSATSLTASNALITNNLAVNGTASFNYVQTITGSAVIIGQEYIILNTQIPASRYAGIKVYDSGSNATASIVWDSLTNHWVYENQSGSTYSGGGFLAGPKNTGSLGDIIYPTQYRILRSQGDDHVYDSNIIDNDTAVKIGINTEVTGGLIVSAGITGSLLGTASFANNATSASYAATATNADTASFVTLAQTASFVTLAQTASFVTTAQTASFVENAQTASFVTTAQTASFVTTAQTASFVQNAQSASVATSASQAQNAVSASYSTYAVTSSYSLAGSGFPFSGSAVITGSLLVTDLSGSGVRYVVTDATGLLSAQSASAAIKTTQAFTATAGQTTFAVTNGYSTGYVDVFINGSKLNATEFTDTSGTNIVLATGSFANDIVEVVKYLPASGVSNNVLRQQTTFTASASQTVFSASYTPGLLDIFYNGAKLSPDDFTANNGTYFTLATASAANDIIDVFVYSYQVGAFSGIGGVGTASQIAYFNTSNSITGSPNFTISGSTMTVTGSLIVSGSGTFTNIGPAVFSGSITSTAGFTGSFSGTATSASYAVVATSASYAANATSASYALNTTSASYTLNATTASHAITASSADDLLVRGTLTAQTIVVQTITSSQDFVTGSTKFGSIISNTHQFTGSVGISGSLSGTSATFSGNLNLQAGVTRNINFYDSSNTNINAQIQYDQISSNSGQLFFGTNNAGTFATRLTIASTGAATFSSSVTATQFTSQGGRGTSYGYKLPDWQIYNTTSGNALAFSNYTTDLLTIASNGNTSIAGDLALTPNDSAITFSSGAGRFFTGGSEKMRITSGGNVIVNPQGTSALLASQFVNKQRSDTTTPYLNGITNMASGSSTELQIYYDGNVGAHYINSTYYTGGDGGTYKPLAFSTSDVERMRITNNGNILINQTSSFTGVSTSVEMSGVGSSTSTLQASYNVFANHGAANTTWRGYYVFHRSRGTTAGSVTAVAAEDFLGTIRWNGADGTGEIIAAEINAKVDGTVGTNDMPTRLEFSTTADGGSSPTERMRINSAGNVRILNVGSQLQFDTDGSGGSTTLGTNGQYDFRIYNGRGGASNIDVSTYEIVFGMNGSTNRYRMGSGAFYPAGDNAYTLGASGQRWSAVWAANGTIQTSDARQKKDITDSNLGLEFINRLRPVSYKWKVGHNVVTSEGEIIDENGATQSKDVITPVPGTRTHYGLIAQEVKEALGDIDFGGYVYDEDTDTMALRYDQFIAPLIKAIQEQQAQIQSLQAEINELKNK